MEREIRASDLTTPFNGVCFKSVIDLALETLIVNLQRYGNRLSEKQKTSLYEILGRYTFLAQGRCRGRYAYPLATGLGKTQSIVAWCSAIRSLRYDHISVAVCASKVEALCVLKRDLIKQGVPMESIGLLHSYKHDPKHKGEPGYASEPCTDDHDQKQILLVTHSRVRGKGGTDLYNTYRGKARSLLIWDESLLISDTKSVKHREIRAALAWLTEMLTGKGKLREACEYLKECSGILHQALTDQKGKSLVQKAPQVMHMPERTAVDLHLYRESLPNHESTVGLKVLLDISQSPLRVAQTDQNDGVITYDIVVDPALKNIVILDASHVIRDLAKLDSTIENIGKFSDDILSYKNVVVHQLRHASGRSTMTDAFKLKKREDRKVSQEIVDLVKEIPQNEGVLIFTFKPRPRQPHFERILQTDLKASGVKTSAKVKVKVWSEEKQNFVDVWKPRFVWLTWGQETSLSEFSYCSNVVFAGVLHRDHVELAAEVAGQRDDLLTDLSGSLIADIAKSEIVHCVYQAMSRGSCRIADGEVTRPMNAWLIHKDTGIKDLIEKVMPGVQWQTWEAKHLLPKGKIQELAKVIADYLAELPGETEKVSTTQIKRDLNLVRVPLMTFTHALEVVSDKPGWTLEGRSLKRDACPFPPVIPGT